MGLIIGIGNNRGGALVKPIIVDTLPTASADTMNKVYLVPSNSDTDMFDVYYTVESGGSYSWEQDGTVSREGFEIADNLTTNDATKALSAKQGKVLADAGAATAAEVTALGQEVDGLDVDVYGGNRYQDIDGLTIDDGYYYHTAMPTTPATISTTKSALTGYSCCKLQVSPGEKFKIYGMGGSYAIKLFAFGDSNLVLLSDSGNAVDASTGVEFTAPANAAWLIVNFKNYDSSTDKLQKLSQVTGVISKVEDLQDETAEINDRIDNLDYTINPVLSNPLQGVTFPDSTPQSVVDAISKIWISSGDVDGVEKVIANAPTLYLAYISNATGNYRPLVAIATTDIGTADDQAFSGYLESQDTPRSVKEDFPCIARNPYRDDWGVGYTTTIHIEIDWSKISGTINGLHIVLDVAKLNRASVPLVTLKDLSRELINKSTSGKKIVCFGDSLTEMKDNVNGKSYPEYIAEFSGADVVNVGIGGSQLRRRSLFFEVFDPSKTYAVNDYCIYTDENDGTSRLYRFTSPHTGAWDANDVTLFTYQQLAYSNLDVISLIEASAAQDFTDIVAACKVVKETQGDDNTAIIDALVAIDWSKVDAITIFAGTNDWYNANTLGASGSTDPQKTLGAINEIVRVFLTAYPQVKIFWFTPVVRWLAYNGGSTDDSMFSDNYSVEGNGTLKEECAAIIAEVTKNHLPICDMYNNFGWNKYNCTQYFVGTDGTHPRTYAGVTYLANKILNFLLANKTF